MCHFTGLKRQIENASQYEPYFIRFLNTKKQFHQRGNDIDAPCKPFEAFRLIGCIPILPVSPHQSGGGEFAHVMFAAAGGWSDAFSEGDHILVGFNLSALCR